MLFLKNVSLTSRSSKEYLINITTQYYSTPIGELLLGEHEGKICLCDWRYRKQREAIDQRIQRFTEATYTEGSSSALEDLKLQLEEYFKKERTSFDIPLKLCGTPFQQKVWRALIDIPHGKTMSYMDLSRQLDNEKAIRAVASANGANAISILVPCHRIIGTNGELIGYAGGLPAKKSLLQLEGSFSQLDLF